jgi:CheY-like chemotaxis protein
LADERASRHDVSALVVDDDVHLRALLTELLEDEGFDVTTASNGFSGLRLAEERRPRLMLLDVVMPELSGAEVLHELRASSATRDIAVVVITGNAQSLSADELADADGLVRKPFDAPELLAAVHRAFQRATSRHAAGVVPPAAQPHHEPRPVRHATSRRTRGHRR